MALNLKDVINKLNELDKNRRRGQDVSWGNMHLDLPYIDMTPSSQNKKGDWYSYTSGKADTQSNTSANTSTNTSTGTSRNNSSYVFDAYSKALERQNNMLREQYLLNESRRRRQMENTVNANNLQSREDMREAYIQNMMSKKNLPQLLRANGISGGGAESVVADLLNTYMNNRNNIAKQTRKQNARAQNAFENGVSDDYSKYLSGKMSLEKSAYSKLSSTKNARQRQKLVDYCIALGLNEDEIKDRMKSLGII